ncbi:TetR/AcrR family transcriptional regulator [Oceanobacillus manasiensis]|uniref:TetR/AcrR family transcriptional regulator n=1 Tax=Oceanobacillus manasiensis TaxID=586413 RepID=UPI0005A76BE9|nr:TetR/AcrR family transcriptional regulator [Oceanobacillus manasiensis]
MNERKRQVLLTAQRLFIEKGFSATSVQDILEGSKISKGTFYNYFTSKNECLVAILEYVNEETFVRRRELLIGESKQDKTILARQIAVRMQINREENLFMLFEAIFHSGDQELRDFVKKNHLKELFWLSERLADVYGEKASPYALDGAALLLGMMQQVFHIWAAASNNLGDVETLVMYVLRQMDSIIPSIISNKDTLLNEDVVRSLKRSLNSRKYSRDHVMEQLNGFAEKLSDEANVEGKQCIHFLWEELNAEHPRIYLIETVTRAFTNAFTGTTDELEAREIASRLWSYVDTVNNG